MRRIAVLDAPSNLGLRPPTATSVPGCAKAPGALRDHGLVTRLAARDAGCVTPPRFDPGDWRPGDGVAHAEEIAWYSRRLADRIGALLDAGEFPVVLGGDCSILLGSALAANRRSSDLDAGIGLVYVDGHSDFRHPGNASYVGAAAGEDLALATGRGQADLAAIENRRPYFRDSDVVVLGIRPHDEHRLDLQAAGIAYRAAPQLRAEGAARSAQWARGVLSGCVGYWVHVDVDVLDPAVMPAVDAPDPGGIAYTELELLLAGLVATPHCLGVEITVFDPDYDPTGAFAADVVETLVAGLAPAATVAPLDWAALAASATPLPAPVEPLAPRMPMEPLAPLVPVVPALAGGAGPGSTVAGPGSTVAGPEPIMEPEADAEPEAVVELEAAGPDVVDESDVVHEAEAEAVAGSDGGSAEPDEGNARPGDGSAGSDDEDERRQLGSLAPRVPLDRMSFSDMMDADRAALARRRDGAIPLRRRGGAPQPADAEAQGAADMVERDAPDADRPPATDPARPFAGLAEQVRAAGSGQVPIARTPVEPPAMPAAPAPPPAETA
ncbi:hypothetical protein Pme01_03670 [Planosporangium mesophilum]|uniref:Arginase n=1 Tax=Planosporangium mesophilum TaxID=689768 RepID=A0A8J3T589_9ACTN|nr:hypothetical protein Pme01_03670 [Planosporangium mesophilum]